MPYGWVPASFDPRLELLKEPPVGAICDFKNAYLDDKQWHKCPMCKGWIEGAPNEYREDTIGPLCGRRGTTSHCRRCGWEIGFSGMMS